jgi:hypothetical protein
MCGVECAGFSLMLHTRDTGLTASPPIHEPAEAAVKPEKGYPVHIFLEFR